MEDPERNTVPRHTEPPPLPYSLHTRKKSIAFFWTIFVLDTLGQPVALYWGLWYGTNLSHNLGMFFVALVFDFIADKICKMFSIVTACLGGISVFEYFYRLHNLFKKGSCARPLNAPKSRLDFFHINFTIVWLILAVELIAYVGNNPSPYFNQQKLTNKPVEPFLQNQLVKPTDNKNKRNTKVISLTSTTVRLVAMVLPTVMFYFGIVHLVLDILRMAGFKAPFRISSTPKGSPMPTALYALIEDVVAVDGGGGQIYRYALRTRYLSSPYFRRMLFEMNCFWSGGSIICAAAITAIIFTVEESVAFTLGWSLPFAWALIWTAITIPWVQSDLRREKKAWAENRGQGGIPWTDDITAPTARTRFASVQERLPNLLPWSREAREKQSAPSTPSVDGVEDGAQATAPVVAGAPEVPATAHRPERILLGAEEPEGATDLAALDEKNTELPGTETAREATASTTADAGAQPSSH
ncbi:hypothetical protein N7466_000257 [Penicillium verhagenii]|uniref:uncharacterized protein n=1 Tax=Penicillium verhagenii TaxID=1562060 RepID=UPI002545BB73|nr:uncharacterized protein N7466_000257 [Penicillium verhagenii]KAJ5947242.1 hypothetical protein N7466_000257 [Penicillium verhagenii]